MQIDQPNAFCGIKITAKSEVPFNDALVYNSETARRLSFEKYIQNPWKIFWCVSGDTRLTIWVEDILLYKSY